ncbi:hypothetical protein, partial [Klebsiella pneumoniae]|uniref:hypothetical protein n=1 Tax=Klebsiella pneumoniae TaxID=573 RepID=UPI002731AF75
MDIIRHHGLKAEGLREIHKLQAQAPVFRKQVAFDLDVKVIPAEKRCISLRRVPRRALFPLHEKAGDLSL